MSDPLTDRLGRFTPDATGLDRDAILFAAGRGSVRPQHHWKTVAAVLALTQTLTLALLLPWPGSRPAGAKKEPAVAPRLLKDEDYSPSERGAPSLTRQRMLEDALQGAPPAGTDSYVPDAAPLSARDVLHALPLN
jgi:hypothetical protein